MGADARASTAALMKPSREMKRCIVVVGDVPAVPPLESNGGSPSIYGGCTGTSSVIREVPNGSISSPEKSGKRFTVFVLVVEIEVPAIRR